MSGHITIRTISRIAGVLTLALTLLTFFVAARARAAQSGTAMGGTVPFCANWTLTEPDVTSFTSSVDQAAYEADCIIVTDLIQITDFDCNTKFKITATKGTWTLPADYHATDGAKKADGSDSDLLLMVDNITAGYATDGLAALGAYGSNTAITTTGSDIIGGGAVTVGAPHGVENAACDVNAKILMDWATDIVGVYSISITLSISEVTD